MEESAVFMPNARSRAGWRRVALLIALSSMLLFWALNRPPSSASQLISNLVTAALIYLWIYLTSRAIDAFVAAACRRSLARLREALADSARRRVVVRVLPQAGLRRLLFGRFMGRDFRDAVDETGRSHIVESSYSLDAEFEAELFDVGAPLPWRPWAPRWAVVPVSRGA